MFKFICDSTINNRQALTTRDNPLEVAHLSEIASLISFEFHGLGDVFLRDGVVKFTLTLPVIHESNDATPYLTEACFVELETSENAVFFEGEMLSWGVLLATCSPSPGNTKTLIATLVADVTNHFRYIAGAFNAEDRSLWQQSQLFRLRASLFVEDIARETDNITAQWERIVKNTDRQITEMSTQQKLYGT